MFKTIFCYDLCHTDSHHGLSHLYRRFKEKKEKIEPEADPERDQRTVFAYQMPLKATERDVYEFFSQAGKDPKNDLCSSLDPSSINY